MVGLYEILKRAGNSYKVKLLDTIKVHLVFPLDKLRKASNDPLLGQQNDPLLPIQVSGNDEWEVDEILASKIVRGPCTTGSAGKVTTLTLPSTPPGIS